MIDLRFKPSHLPQVNSPFGYVLKKLKEDGIGYKLIDQDPNLLKPTQGVVFLDKISEIDSKNIKPIWCSESDDVLDGHHRYGSSLMNGNNIKTIKILLPTKDAIRILNKIQDIYDYTQQQRMEEVVAQDQINYMNDPNILDEVEKDIENKVLGKKKKFTAFRKNPINEKSSIGNFFSVQPIDGYKKFEIEFDNVLDTDDLNIPFQRDINPIERLASLWFPNIDFKSIAKSNEIKPENLINRIISEKAKKMGYDGIKYGDIIIQGLK